MSTQIQITPKSGITIGSTEITSGTDNRILFQNSGVVSQSANLTYNGNSFVFNGAGSTGFTPILDIKRNGSSVFYVDEYGSKFNGSVYANTIVGAGLSGIALANSSGVGKIIYAVPNEGKLAIGYSTSTNNAALDIKSQGTLSTDIIQRWRNSADTANIGKITGDGAFTFGTYTNPNTRLSISGGTIQGAYISGLGTAMYVQNETSSGTGYAAQFLGRQYGMGSPSGYNTFGILSGADTTNGINYGIKSYAYNGATNYAGYFDATSGTVNYAIFVQRGKVNLGTLPTSSAGLSTGDIWNDGGVLKVV